jgi:uncharacterized protein DUF4232
VRTVLAAAVALTIIAGLSVQPWARASVARCLMPGLSVRLAGDVSPPTGAHPIALSLVNRGAAACAVRGYPAVELSDANGVIPFVYSHRGDAVVTARPPRRVLLRPGGSAYVLLDKFRCDLGDRRVSTRVRLWIEGASARGRPVPLSGMRISLCKPGIPAEGRVVHVSPFEPTLTATLRRPTGA